MAVKVRTKRPDKCLKKVLDVLEKYAASHPTAQIEVYRHTSVSIRLRVIDPAFKGQSRRQREEELWRHFEQLPDDVVADITVVLMYTPEEAKKSWANMEFDDPVPSRLA